jgi:hypothetical protein
VTAFDYAIPTSDFVLSPCANPGWLLIEEGLDPAREREIDSLFAIGNGYLGNRASIAEDGRFSHPSTFVAGIYVADGERLHVEAKVESQRFLVEAGCLLSHRRMLDLRQGVLWREWRQQDPSGRISRLTYLVCHLLAVIRAAHKKCVQRLWPIVGDPRPSQHLSPCQGTAASNFDLGQYRSTWNARYWFDACGGGSHERVQQDPLPV